AGTEPAGERQVPFYCPYCGGEDLRPARPAARGWRGGACARAFELPVARGPPRGRGPPSRPTPPLPTWTGPLPRAAAAGRRVALGRAQALLGGGALVHVIGPRVDPALAGLEVTVSRRGYRDGDLAGAWLAHAATGDPAVNARVAADAERLRIWCVRADDAAT